MVFFKLSYFGELGPYRCMGCFPLWDGCGTIGVAFSSMLEVGTSAHCASTVNPPRALLGESGLELDFVPALLSSPHIHLGDCRLFPCLGVAHPSWWFFQDGGFRFVALYITGGWYWCMRVGYSISVIHRWRQMPTEWDKHISAKLLVPRHSACMESGDTVSIIC